jgi:hypothetical protein
MSRYEERCRGWLRRFGIDCDQHASHPASAKLWPALLFGLLALVFAASLTSFVASATAAPATVNGDPFTLVATGPGTTQLFGLTSDGAGRVYAGNNSNNTTGIPLQMFDPALFSGSTIALQNFGPAVGDADGLSFGGGAIYVADRDEGVRRIAVPAATSSVFVAGAAINGTGSPIVFRPADGHLFVGFGATVPSVAGAARIDEYDALGSFVQTFTTVGETETMTFEPSSGLIYYADFGSEVRSFNPITHADMHVGNATGVIDGGLAFDSLSGKIFVGTANGTNSGLVETIDPTTGVEKLFASGFNGSLGILREPVSGDLYFLESNQLYRIDSRLILPGDYNHDGIVDAADYTLWRDGLGTTYTQADYTVWKTNFGQHAGSGAGATAAVPEPASTLLLLTGMLVMFVRRRVIAS